MNTQKFGIRQIHKDEISTLKISWSTCLEHYNFVIYSTDKAKGLLQWEILPKTLVQMTNMEIGVSLWAHDTTLLHKVLLYTDFHLNDDSYRVCLNLQGLSSVFMPLFDIKTHENKNWVLSN